MPLYSFVVTLPRLAGPGLKKTIHACVNQALYNSEGDKKTWLFRPAMYTALELVYRAYKEGRITGAFIFSNNGSDGLVEFVSKYCNYWMARKARDYGRPRIFQLAVSRSSPLRSPGSLEKSYAEVQRALGSAGLTLLSSPGDLLFFDDMSHVLQSEIAHYVQIRPYFNVCPIATVAEALRGCARLVSPEVWARVLEEATADDRAERRADALAKPPTEEDTRQDKAVFRGAFGSFLPTGGTRRRRRRTHRTATRRVGRNK
jgi:hypothetical protein